MSARNRLVAAGCFAVMVGTLVLTRIGDAVAQSVRNVVAAIDQSSPGVTNGVYVRNTPNVNAAVSGNVGISGSVAVTNPAGGSLSVGLNPSGNTVQLDSSTTQTISNANNSLNGKKVVYVMQAGDAMQPYADSVNLFWSSGATDVTSPFFRVVPVGKRLVIEDVSGRIAIETGHHLDEVVLQTFFLVQGIFTDSKHFVVPHLVGQTTGSGGATLDVYQFHATVRAYCDAGSAPVFFADTREIATGDILDGAFVNVSGYFVDLP